MRDVKDFSAARAEELLRRVSETRDPYPWTHYRRSLIQLIKVLPPAKQPEYAERALAILRAPTGKKTSSPPRSLTRYYSDIIDRNAHALAESKLATPDMYIEPIRLAGENRRGTMVGLRVHTPVGGGTPWIYGLQREDGGKLALLRWDTRGKSPRKLAQLDAVTGGASNIGPQIIPGDGNLVFVARHNTLDIIQGRKVKTLSTENLGGKSTQFEQPKYATDGKRLFIAKTAFFGYVDPKESTQVRVVTSYSRIEKTNILDGKSWVPRRLQCDPSSGDVYIRMAPSTGRSSFWRFDAQTLTPQPSTVILKGSDLLAFTPSGPFVVRGQPRKPLLIIPLNTETMTLGESRLLQADDRLYTPSVFAVQGNYAVTSLHGYPGFYTLASPHLTLFREETTLTELYLLADGTLLGLNVDPRRRYRHSLHKIRLK